MNPSSVGRFITDVSPNDVLLGRGAPMVNYPGNVRFREVLAARQVEYSSATRRSVKDDIAREILAVVEGRQGRFLRKIETAAEASALGVPDGVNAWAIADEDTALEKIKQGLRNREQQLRIPNSSGGRQRSSLKRKSQSEPNIAATAAAAASLEDVSESSSRPLESQAASTVHRGAATAAVTTTVSAASMTERSHSAPPAVSVPQHPLTVLLQQRHAQEQQMEQVRQQHQQQQNMTAFLLSQQQQILEMNQRHAQEVARVQAAAGLAASILYPSLNPGLLQPPAPVPPMNAQLLALSMAASGLDPSMLGVAAAAGNVGGLGSAYPWTQPAPTQHTGLALPTNAAINPQLLALQQALRQQQQQPTMLNGAQNALLSGTTSGLAAPAFSLPSTTAIGQATGASMVAAAVTQQQPIQQMQQLLQEQQARAALERLQAAASTGGATVAAQPLPESSATDYGNRRDSRRPSKPTSTGNERPASSSSSEGNSSSEDEGNLKPRAAEAPTAASAKPEDDSSASSSSSSSSSALVASKRRRLNEKS